MCLFILNPPGKLSEVIKTNSILSNQVEKINSTITEDHGMQMNTVKGLERLGDSLASMKGSLVCNFMSSKIIKMLSGEMMGNNHEGAMKSLKDKTAKLEKQVESVSAKHLKTSQDVTRNTGRLNKVELDMKKISADVDNVEKEQVKVRKVSETKIGNINKLAG